MRAIASGRSQIRCSLLATAEIRQQAARLGIIKIEFGEKGGFIEFGAKKIVYR
ncbi:hypothetical protein PT276_06445 [Orbaceae bacterium ESL0721]|nr:hypothetical protein [Orbaceae bacterium ESL0721]